MSKQTATTIDFITGPDRTGPAGAVRLSRGASGLEASIDGAAPTPLGGSVVSDGTTIEGTGTDDDPLAVVNADAWYDEAVSAMKVLVPGLTRFEYVKLPALTVASPGVSVDVVGGAVGVASDSVHYKSIAFASVWPTPRTSLIGCAWRVKFPAIASAKTSIVAICLSGAGGNIAAGWDHGTSATKWVLSPAGGTPTVSTFNADTNWHTVLVTSDGTTITFVIDGVTVATSTDVGTLTNTACLPSTFSSATLTPGALCSRVAYGYADAT